MIYNMNVEALHPVYQELVDLIGWESTLKMHAYYHGQQIGFPMRLHHPSYMTQVLQTRYDGTNLNELARELGYSERRIRKKLTELNM